MSRTSHAAAARPALNPSRAALAALAALDADAEHESSLAIKRTLTSVADAGVHKPVGVPASVFEAGWLARPAPKPRKPAVLINMASIVIETGVPLPKNNPRATTRAYDSLIAQLVPGTSVLLASNQARTLRAAAKKRGVSLICRAVDDQRSRVWCPPDDGAVATGPSIAAAITPSIPSTPSTGASK